MLGARNWKQTSKLKSMKTMKWEIQILYRKTIVVSGWTTTAYGDQWFKWSNN